MYRFFFLDLYIYTLCHPYNIQLKCTRNNSYFPCFIKLKFFWKQIIIPPLHRRGGYTVLPLSVLLSVRTEIFFVTFFSATILWQKSDIWSQASYRYTILWEAFLNPPSDSYFLFADLVGFYTHWTYMLGYHMCALANSSSCLVWLKTNNNFSFMSHILM